MMKFFCLRFVFIGLCFGLMPTSMPVSAQVINVDMSNDSKLLIRKLEMESSLKSIEESSAKENRASKEEYEQSLKVFEQTLDKFYDCAPGLTARMTEWSAIRGVIEMTGKQMFKHGNDSIYKKMLKRITDRMFTMPEAATMPGDVVWRRYKDAFIRAEKAFLGSSELSGIEDLLGTASGVVEGELTSIKGTVDRLGNGENGKGILEEGYISNEKLTEGFRKEVARIIDDVKLMHDSWVSSADKESYYQKKLQELNRLYAQIRGANWVDFILESEKTDRMNINEEVRKTNNGRNSTNN